MASSELTEEEKRLLEQAAAANGGNPSGLPNDPAAATTTTTSTTAPKHDLLNFDAMVAEGFDVSKLKTEHKSYEKSPASFVTGGGTPGEKAALARKVANMTIRKTTSAADRAAIQKARKWLTGQTAGRVKGKTYYSGDSIKGIEHGGKGNPRPAAPKPTTTSSKSSSSGGGKPLKPPKNTGSNPAATVANKAKNSPKTPPVVVPHRRPKTPTDTAKSVANDLANFGREKKRR